jgi:hypothetical protein
VHHVTAEQKTPYVCPECKIEAGFHELTCSRYTQTPLASKDRIEWSKPARGMWAFGSTNVVDFRDYLLAVDEIERLRRLTDETPRDARYEALFARLTEAESLILRMSGEGTIRARFYVEKYDLTNERGEVKTSRECNGKCRGHSSEASTSEWLPDPTCPAHGSASTRPVAHEGE